jgi:hypothetical protein
MKKFLEILKYAPCFALSLMLMTSCDKEADKLQIETTTLNYSGTFYMYLYSDDISEESMLAIDIDTVPGNIKIDISNEGSAIVNFVPGREIRLATPFFYKYENAEGEYEKDEEGYYIYTIPMDIYKDSPITKLYDAVDEDVNITDAERTTLRRMLGEIRDTITISPFTTSKFPLIQQGATIVSYDNEQNSFYSAYNLVEEETYSHKSSLTKVIKYVRDNLLSKMAADKKDIAVKAIQTMESINSSYTGKMNVWGRLSLQYMNYYCEYVMQIKSEKERPNEMLVSISKVLYGDDKGDGTGNPNKDLGFVIGYVGHMGDSSGNWVEQREE